MGRSAAIRLQVSASVHSSNVKVHGTSMVVLVVVLLSLFHDFPFCFKSLCRWAMRAATTLSQMSPGHIANRTMPSVSIHEQ